MNINRTAWMGSQCTGVLQAHSTIFNTVLIVTMCSASCIFHTQFVWYTQLSLLCSILRKKCNGKFCWWDFSYLKTFQRSHYHTGRQWVHNGCFPDVSLPWGKMMFLHLSMINSVHTGGECHYVTKDSTSLLQTAPPSTVNILLECFVVFGIIPVRNWRIIRFLIERK